MRMCFGTSCIFYTKWVAMTTGQGRRRRSGTRNGRSRSRSRGSLVCRLSCTKRVVLISNLCGKGQYEIPLYPLMFHYVSRLLTSCIDENHQFGPPCLAPSGLHFERYWCGRLRERRRKNANWHRHCPCAASAVLCINS